MATTPAGVYLVVCCNRSMKPVTAQSITMAMLHGSTRYRLGWGMGHDSDIGRSRSMQASQFLWNRSLGDVLVFVDDDIGFGSDDFELLIEDCLHTQEIVCGMYVVRDTAFPHPALTMYPGQKVDFGKKGLVEIKWAAAGFMAIHRRALERLEQEFPWECDGPVQSGPRWMWPFFLEMIHDGQYLSEDYALCQRAKRVGVKTWLDTGIKLSHNGERAYTLKDLHFDAFMQATTLTIDEGGPDPTGVLHDLGKYLGLTRAEVWRKLQKTPYRESLALEWRQLNPQTPEQVEAFYRNTPHYLFDLAKFNVEPGYNLRTYPIRMAQGRVIDFGGGIGTVSLVLNEANRHVTYVDLPSPHREFAQWRFQEHEAAIGIADRLEVLPTEAFDAIVSVDTLEHLHPERLPAVVKEISRVLTSKGVLLEISDFHQSQDLPQHYETGGLLANLLTGAGFRPSGQQGFWQRGVINDATS